jgi:hypothetical protein
VATAVVLHSLALVLGLEFLITDTRLTITNRMGINLIIRTLLDITDTISSLTIRGITTTIIGHTTVTIIIVRIMVVDTMVTADTMVAADTMAAGTMAEADTTVRFRNHILLTAEITTLIAETITGTEL